GRLSVRARVLIEDVGRGDRQAIVVTELPYQVNKARLIERIAELVREKQLDGIAADGLRDESDKDGMRIVIELKRGEGTEIVLNNLYAHTPMETVFGIDMVALQDGQPKLMSLKEMLEAFIRHRREVVTRRSIYELAKARERAHILEGLAVALANIDAVIALIKAAASPAEARTALQARSWAPGAVTELLARAGEISTRPPGLRAESGVHGRSRRPVGSQRRIRPARRQLSAVGDAGAGDPRHAVAPPHRARAGQDHRRIPRAADQHCRSQRHSRPSGAAHPGGARRAHRGAREVW